MALFGAKVHTTFSLLDSYIPLPEVAEHDDRTEKTQVQLCLFKKVCKANQPAL